MKQIKNKTTYFIRLQTNSRNISSIGECSYGGKVNGSGIQEEEEQ